MMIIKSMEEEEYKRLILSNVLNLDAEIFIKSLDEIIEDNENNIEEEYVGFQNIDEIEDASDTIDWNQLMK